MSATTLRAGVRDTAPAELVTGEREFAELAEAWGRLYRRCGAATAFQSHAWLHSWWLSYGTPGRLRLMVVREGGELLAVAPLMRARRRLPMLVPLGGPISDYADVLLDDEHADRAAALLAEGLSAAARTALIDFREVRPGGAMERVYEHWSGPRRRVGDSLCLELPATSMDELVGRLPRPRPSASGPSCANSPRSGSNNGWWATTRWTRPSAGCSNCTGCSGRAGR